MKKNHGNVGVDSGQLLIIDPCYVWEDDFKAEGKATGLPYDTACRLTLGKDGCGEVEGGFVFGTAYGDGTYSVTVERNAHGGIVRVIIDLDEMDEMDEDEWEDDEDE